MSITADTVIAAYVETRNEIKELENKIADLKVLQARKEEWLMQKMMDDGVESMRSKHGTAYSVVFESVTVADADEFFNWVKENDRFDCIEKRAAKTEILHIMGERETTGRPNSPPPGLSYTAVKKVNIRKG